MSLKHFGHGIQLLFNKPRLPSEEIFYTDGISGSNKPFSPSQSVCLSVCLFIFLFLYLSVVDELELSCALS